ncbi:PREDICTED: mucosal addressin cell adhesion molecule 1 isoform X1 [Dipodomys ordii]|uniref:Mucosal addressin cell adhesion molecule 1 isoform X1 n=1 Tax=Dipodomys ordii TaxID=10020 RepID=A0A1S3FQU4_DIPOR|nr:PREDICTED: mucosal addressin cell adhesion molecule 1 isoform X1 [Dipodomys ordii]
MKHGLTIVLALSMSLGFLQPGHGQPLQVEPPEPVISVPMGGSCQLNCSLSCTDGMVALVKWHGLDITQGAVQSSPGISVLSVHEATLSATGTRRCVGSCGARSFQHSVQILVYAFPDQLAVSPTALVPGQSQEVSCTAHNVTPVGPDTLFFTLLLGGQELEGVQALGREEEEEDLQEAEGPLFQVTERWWVPALAISTLPALLCRATMRLPGLEQSHCRAFPVLHSQTSPAPPGATSWESSSVTFTDAPQAISRDLALTVSSEHPATSSLPTTPQQSSTHSPKVLGSSGTCHPEIHQVSRTVEKDSPWELLCEAPCGSGTAVHWTLAPGGLAAYHRKEAGAQAWLSVPPATSVPGGWFQCRLDPGGQVASLYVPGQVFPKTSPGPEVVQPPTAPWVGSLVLGLLLLAMLTYCLWKHWRTQAEEHTHLPAPLRLLPLPE